MPHTLAAAGSRRSASAAAICIGRRVGAAAEGCLRRRLEGVVVYGSAADGSYLRGLSDIDCAVFHRGSLGYHDYVTMHRALGTMPVAPFVYLQLKYVDVHAEPRPALIPGSYMPVYGSLEHLSRWEWKEAELLAQSLAVLQELPRTVLQQAQDWSSAIAERRARQIRLMLTHLKPALRSTLVLLGDPALATWSDPYSRLAMRLAAYDRPLAKSLVDVLCKLPMRRQHESLVGEAVLESLRATNELARSILPCDSGLRGQLS